MNHYSKHLFICTNQKAAGKQCCANAGSEVLFDYLKRRLVGLGLHGPGKVRVSKSGCMGRCNEGPCIVIYPESVWYTYRSEADIDDIVDIHLIQGKKLARLLIDTN